VGTFFLSIRFRLAFTYSLLVFALAVAVVGVVNYALSRSLQSPEVSTTRQLTTIIDPATGQRFTIERDVQLQFVTLEQLVNARAVDELQRISFWVIVALFPASVAIGWFVADRALRPIGRITAVAKEIRYTDDLSRRIALTGPEDELKDLADMFDEMLDRIEDDVDARRTFVQDVSHELRNPLAVMATNLDVVLGDEDADAAELRETAAVVRRTVDRTARTVDDLVVFARSSVPEEKRIEVDLGAVLDDVLAEHARPAEAAGLRVEVVGGSVVVSAEPVGVKRAVGNIVNNAVRLSRRGSAVRCGTGSTSGFAWVGVVDGGPGIDPRDHEHVFRRFYSRHSESIAGESRSGLGLAIARQVAESHGGTITVESELGAGATFVLWLPLRADASVEDVSGDGVHPRAGQPRELSASL
jgi:signal transduction histidine kinase